MFCISRFVNKILPQMLVQKNVPLLLCCDASCKKHNFFFFLKSFILVVGVLSFKFENNFPCSYSLDET